MGRLVRCGGPLVGTITLLVSMAPFVLMAPAAEASTTNVSIVDFAFVQPTVTVALGDDVTWTNNGFSAHTVTADDGSFDSSPSCPPSGCLTSGNTYNHTFTTVGAHPYHCKLHGAAGIGMAGTVIVEPPAATFHSLAPARIQDSRSSSQVGPYSTPWGQGTIRDVTVGGAGGVPADADAVVLNVTVTDTTKASFLTLWPKDATQPLASNLNWTAGQTIPNQVTAKLGTAGGISIYNPGGNVDVIIDVDGYYKAGSGTSFHALPPSRIQDSRSATQVGAYNTPWSQGTTRDVAVRGAGGVPASADAVILNVTVTDTTAASFLTIWPKSATQPVASSLNWVSGQTIPNAVTTKLGTGGNISVFNPGGFVDVIADVNGYFS